MKCLKSKRLICVLNIFIYIFIASTTVDLKCVFCIFDLFLLCHDLKKMRFDLLSDYLPTGEAALNARSSDSSVLFIDADCTCAIKIAHIISEMSIIDLLIFIDIIVVNLFFFFSFLTFKNQQQPKTKAASV